MLVERILHASLRHTRQKNQERMFERKMRHRNFQFSHVIGRWNRAKCCIPKLGIIGLEKNCRNLFFKMKLYFYPTDLETNITIHFSDVSPSSYSKNPMIVPIFSMSLFPSESLASESRTTFVHLSTLVIPPTPTGHLLLCLHGRPFHTQGHLLQPQSQPLPESSLWSRIQSVAAVVKGEGRRKGCDPLSGPSFLPPLPHSGTHIKDFTP